MLREMPQETRVNREIETTLDQLILLQKNDPLYDERLAIDFLTDLGTSPDVDPHKLRAFFTGLWKRLATQKTSQILIHRLIQLDFNYIRQKLDKIALEADRDGWNLIKYLDGYTEIFELCLRDVSGMFFQSILKYFAEKVHKKDFLDKVSQQMAKTLIDDVRYRKSMREFCELFPEKLAFCTRIFEETNCDVTINEMTLNEVLKSSQEDFLMLTIGFSEFVYLIKTVNC